MRTLKHLASTYRGWAKQVDCVPLASKVICGEVAKLFEEKAAELEALAGEMIADPRCDVRHVRKLRAVIGEQATKSVEGWVGAMYEPTEEVEE